VTESTAPHKKKQRRMHDKHQGIYWKDFRLNKQVYDLSHLHPRIMSYSHQLKGSQLTNNYTVQIIFGLHCFTRGMKNDVDIDVSLHYSDSRECRVFDFTRYELSKLLPDIIGTLLERKCYHTGKGNFLTVEIITEDGHHQNYEIYFVVSRSKLGILTLYVQSAYLGDKIHPAKNSRIKKIGFNVILFNTLRNKPIKPPA
jgi:hypothetical protein